ncbi:Arylamine N-acetyltransferase [Pseudozyma hubeiensis]|nr:Arylamine N-acetyltransferase [Pseudozyma hubeiensis]
MALSVSLAEAMDSASGQPSSENRQATDAEAIGGANPPFGLPSDRALDDAMLHVPFREGMSMYTLRDHEMPWATSLFVDPTGSHHYIPAFVRNVDGKHFGPLRMGGYKFRLVDYPHELPYLEEMHTEGNDWIPINFEELSRGRTLRPGEWVFRPDPLILDEIESSFRRWHRLQGREVEKVQKTSGLRHARFVWPPLEIQPPEWMPPYRLYMPNNNLMHLRTGVNLRLGLHDRLHPTVYHLLLPTFHGPRHIMMTKLDEVINTHMPAKSRNSDFWLLQEAMVRPESLITAHQIRPVYAVLGGMFLPKDAPEMFRDHMYPALV